MGRDYQLLVTFLYILLPSSFLSVFLHSNSNYCMPDMYQVLTIVGLRDMRLVSTNQTLLSWNLHSWVWGDRQQTDVPVNK